MTYSAEVLADSPLVYLRLGESSGTTAADSSGNSRNGTYVGSPTLGVAGAISGDANTAVTFDGSTQAVTVPSTGLPTTDVDQTIECWVKFTSTTTGLFVAGRDVSSSTRGVCIRTGTVAGTLMCGNTVGTSPQSTGTYNDGNWHHVVGLRHQSAGTFELYVDNVSVASGTESNSTLGASGFFVAERGNGTLRFPGTIDEAAYYGTALSSTRIAAHYAAGTSSGAFTGTASTTATASTSGAGVVGAVITAALAAVATITAAGVVATSTDAGQPVTATISATGVVAETTDATLAASATIATDGVVGTATDATLATTADLTADGTVNTATDANLTATASITAEGLVVSGKQGSAATTVTVTITADGSVAVSTDATAPVAATITADGQVGVSVDAALTAAADIAVTGQAHLPPRDLDLAYTIAPDRWVPSYGSERWSASYGGDRWTATTGSEQS